MTEDKGVSNVVLKSGGLSRLQRVDLSQQRQWLRFVELDTEIVFSVQR
jgi:hypothetical protein